MRIWIGSFRLTGIGWKSSKDLKRNVFVVLISLGVIIAGIASIAVYRYINRPLFCTTFASNGSILPKWQSDIIVHHPWIVALDSERNVIVEIQLDIPDPTQNGGLKYCGPWLPSEVAANYAIWKIEGRMPIRVDADFNTAIWVDINGSQKRVPLKPGDVRRISPLIASGQTLRESLNSLLPVRN